jgi:beta-lysine 5,6-aminomutase alpha subunit
LLVAPENERELEVSLAENGADVIFTTNLKDVRADHLRKKSAGFKRFATSVSGLNAPQDVMRASFTGIDMIGCDTIGEIVKSGINPKRVLVDAHWVCRLCSKMGIILFAENAHMRDLDGYRDTHQATASQFLIEQLAFQGKIVPEQLSLGHLYDINPALEGSFLLELARASMVRDFYPRNPIVYLPPSRFLTGSDVEKSLTATLFFSSSIITEQSIVALPSCVDLSGTLKSAHTIVHATRSLGDELQFIPNGKIDRRANTILENTVRLLRKMETQGLLSAFAHGLIAGVRVDEKGGAGLDGIFQKDRGYFNPIEEYLDGKKSATELRVVPTEKRASSPDLAATPPKKEQQSRRHFPGRYHRRRRNSKSTRKMIEKTKGTNYPPRNE